MFYLIAFKKQFDLPALAIDLMLVDEEVFLVLEETKADLAPIATPGFMAMVALKLQAIRQPV